MRYHKPDYGARNSNSSNKQLHLRNSLHLKVTILDLILTEQRAWYLNNEAVGILSA